MTTPLEQQLLRIEATLAAILEVTNPTMSFQEVQRVLNYKSRDATRKWLKDHNIPRVDRGYRRVLVIAGATKAKR